MFCSALLKAVDDDDDETIFNRSHSICLHNSVGT